jgi:hypothetical protein
MSITYSECVSVALVIQHVKVKHHIILSSVTWLACYNLTNLELCKEILTIISILNCMKIRPVGTEGFHADGRTDTDRQA